MPIRSAEFTRLIFEKLKLDGKENSISKLYGYVEQESEFDQHDLRSTILKGKSTGEPSWKRNLRNALQSAKRAGELVNGRKDHWRLPTPNTSTPINPTISWDLIKQAAKDLHSSKEPWTSPIDQHSYWIRDVSETAITIKREARFKNDEKITRSDVINAITAINAAGTFVGRGTLNNTVAKEAAIVQLHPQLSVEGNNVVNSAINIEEVKKIIPLLLLVDPEDDDVTDLSKYARRTRKGRKKFYDGLMKNYGMCCISRVKIESVLEAVHIEPHHKNGRNALDNGLILRSDIHCLFDDNLIVIHPERLIVVIHPDLRPTSYGDFHGRELLKPLDGKRPNQDYLQARWIEAEWTESDK